MKAVPLIQLIESRTSASAIAVFSLGPKSIFKKKKKKKNLAWSLARFLTSVNPYLYFPGGLVVKNLPANEDMGSLPGPEDFSCLGELPLCATTTEAQVL